MKRLTLLILFLRYCIVPCVSGGLAVGSVWGLWGHHSDPNSCNHVLAQALGQVRIEAERQSDR